MLHSHITFLQYSFLCHSVLYSILCPFIDPVVNCNSLNEKKLRSEFFRIIKAMTLIIRESQPIRTYPSIYSRNQKCASLAAWAEVPISTETSIARRISTCRCSLRPFWRPSATEARKMWTPWAVETDFHRRITRHHLRRSDKSSKWMLAPTCQMSLLQPRFTTTWHTSSKSKVRNNVPCL